MTEPIISIASIQAKARRHFAAGRPLADCALPPCSAAYTTYQSEYLRLAAAAHATPQFHSAAAGRTRVEPRQSSAGQG